MLAPFHLMVLRPAHHARVAAMQHQLDPHRAQFVRSATAALMPLRHQSRVVTDITRRCHRRHAQYAQPAASAQREPAPR